MLSMLYAVACFVFVFVSTHSVNAEKIEHDEYCTQNQAFQKVSDAIKSGLFRQAWNCTIVEGDLRFYMLPNEYLTEQELAEFTFPNLREVTGCVLIYAIGGLKSLEFVFPQLRIIRGYTVGIDSYSLLIRNNPDLKELGLSVLTEISKGGVYISGNPKLCYASTINWKSITKTADNGDIYIKDSQDPLDCKNCVENQNQATCDTIDSALWFAPQLACWNSTTCQKSCQSSCAKRGLSCSNDLQYCCHPECQGGCSGHNDTDCVACKNVRDSTGRCIKACLSHQFQLGHRCLTRESCSQRRPKFARGPSGSVINMMKYFKPVDGQCTENCPEGFMEAKNGRECVPCPQDGCLIRGSSHAQTVRVKHGYRVCNSSAEMVTVINNFNDAKILANCDEFIGSISVEIRHFDNIDQMVEFNTRMSRIKVITGYLRVAYTPFRSLNMFKHLRNVGTMLDETLAPSGNFRSLFIQNNYYLEHLWDIENNTLNLGKGTVAMEYNPKLCDAEILKFLGQLSETQQNHLTNENGHDWVCKHLPMDVLDFSVRLADNVALYSELYLSWSIPSLFYPNTTITQATVFYRETTQNEPLTINDNRARFFDGWENELKKPTYNSATKTFTSSISGLQAYTWYAFYVEVEAYTHQGIKLGQSELIKAQTYQTLPSPPKVAAIGATDNSFEIHLLPPKFPNGTITHYHVKIRGPFSVPPPPAVSYCDNGAVTNEALEIHAHWNKTEFRRVEQSTNFLNDVENEVEFAAKVDRIFGIKQPSAQTMRYKQLHSIQVQENAVQSHKIQTLSMPVTQMLRFANLSAFSLYRLEVKSCQSANITPSFCSFPEIVWLKTQKDANLDAIQSIYSVGSIVHWSAPETPNALILAYLLKIKLRMLRSNVEVVVHTCIQPKIGTKNVSWDFSSELGFEGHVAVEVRPFLAAGYGPWSTPILFEFRKPAPPPPKKPENFYFVHVIVQVVAVFAAIALVIVLCVFLAVWNRRRRDAKEAKRKMTTASAPHRKQSDDTHQALLIRRSNS